MTNKTNYIIGLSVFALVITIILCATTINPRGEYMPMPTAPEQAPEVLAIRDKLLAKTTEYGAKTEKQISLQKELSTIEAEKTALALSAASYDAVLCNEFGLRFVRPSAAAGSGALVKCYPGVAPAGSGF